MKKLRCFFIILLFFSFQFCLVSCDNAQNFYKKGAYIRALETLNSKKNLSKSDLLIKIKSLNALGRHSEVHDSVLSYLFMSNRDDERETAVRYFVNYNTSDMLNILLLLPSDGYDADTVLFKSFYNLKMYNEAKIILTEYLSAYLSLQDFVKVLIKYRIDDPYTLDFFKSWFQIVTEEEYEAYSQLLYSFCALPLEETLKKETLNFISYIKNSPYSFVLKEL